MGKAGDNLSLLGALVTTAICMANMASNMHTQQPDTASHPAGSGSDDLDDELLSALEEEPAGLASSLLQVWMMA